MTPIAALAPLPAPAPYELWLADLSVEPAPERIDELGDDERQRAARFVFERDRRRYLSAHVALRTVLAARLGAQPGALRFGAGRFGKPHLLDTPRCAFNLSHSGDFAVIALAPDGEIGVDIEVMHAVPDASALAGLHFSAAEQAELAGVTDPNERDRRFLLGWSRKEACLKAIGSGLSLPASTVDAGLQPLPRRLGVPTADGMAALHVQSLELDTRFALALARLDGGAAG